MQARGSREAADNFCLIVRKHDEARGSLDVRQNFNLTSIGSHTLATFPEGESEGEAWKMSLFGVENKLTVNRLPLITSLCEELSPRGEATQWLTILCRLREACIKGNE